MHEKLKDAQMDRLFDAILTLENRDECCRLFEDLCTITELRAMSQRFQVARLLSEGKIYSDVVAETGASTATISRVNRCLLYGNDGYKTALRRMSEHESL